MPFPITCIFLLFIYLQTCTPKLFPSQNEWLSGNLSRLMLWHTCTQPSLLVLICLFSAECSVVYDTCSLWFDISLKFSKSDSSSFFNIYILSHSSIFSYAKRLLLLTQRSLLSSYAVDSERAKCTIPLNNLHACKADTAIPSI